MSRAETDASAASGTVGVAGPNGPRFPCAEGDPAAVCVLATDYGPAGWDGLPFSAWPQWLADAATKADSAIRPVTPGSTDYAEWEVDTDHGVLLATPGDWIASGHQGRLMVLREVTSTTYKPRKFMEPC